jgi:hypothetical protein
MNKGKVNEIRTQKSTEKFSKTKVQLFKKIKWTSFLLNEVRKRRLKTRNERRDIKNGTSEKQIIRENYE